MNGREHGSIVIVDDSPSNLRVLGVMLEAAGASRPTPARAVCR